MAIVQRIKLGVVLDPLIGIELPEPTQGRVRGYFRLWYEQPPPAPPNTPMTPSDKFLVIGDDIGPTSGPVSQRYGQALNAGDAQLMQSGAGAPGRRGWEHVLAQAGVSLDDYLATGHNFVADLALPAAVIDAYTG